MNKINFINRNLCFRNMIDDFNLDISTSIVGYEECIKNKQLIDSNKSCYILHFIVKGKGIIINQNQKKEIISSSECFLIDPNSHVKYKPDPSNPWSYFWIEINGNGLKKLCDHINFKSNNMHLKIQDFNQIINCFANIFNEELFISNQNSEFLRVTSEIMKILSFLIKEHGIEKNQSSLSKEENQIKKIIEYVNNNYTSPDISIKKIADNFYFSQAYLTRIFKKSTGISPMKYIIMLRMRRAVELLNKESFSIAQIAYCVGYKNQFYFSKEFKNYFGVTPSKYNLNPSLLDQHVQNLKK